MADLISAIAALLWPLLVIVVLLVFGRQLLSKLRNSDDVTLEIGGQKLNFKQATDQQSDMITDLQREVASLKRRLDHAASVPGGSTPQAGERTPPGYVLPNPEADAAEELEGPTREPVDTSWMLEEQERRITPPRSILWVDDHPENNAILAESWRRDGAQVDIARSTSAALYLLEHHKYGLIISDMGRRESGEDVPDAGLQLLLKVRTGDPVTPFVLYTSFSQAGRATRVREAEASGASLVTDSTFELTRFASGLGMLDGA
ncbi:response regulator [Promicromonospora sp. NPDC023805]|uniref:response regulator n=1 Tax=Promicromonospora sp. NPDC023805 TaxID=3154696 RepID=UPI0033E1BE82